MILALRSHYQKLKIFFQKYERWLLPATLVFGFLVDYVTFVNIQINTAIIILFAHSISSTLAIAFTYAYDAGKITQKLRYIRLFTPFLTQFNFGGMLSNAFIFYWFSGSLWVSWPFILLFVALMVGNDALREHYARPTVQLSVYFFAVFTILSVSLPFLFNSLSSLWYLLAGLISVLVLAGFVWGLARYSEQGKVNISSLAWSVLGILLISNLFYFTNLIPPVPLAMRETGVYHSVMRSGGQYILTVEQESFWERLLPGRTVHVWQSQPVYVFSAIFAPRELQAKIVHQWQYYDEERRKWVVSDNLEFGLIGGRSEGFRGYSYKTVLPEGKWRVYIKTERGQTLGRVRFDVVRPEGTETFEEVVR